MVNSLNSNNLIFQKLNNINISNPNTIANKQPEIRKEPTKASTIPDYYGKDLIVSKTTKTEVPKELKTVFKHLEGKEGDDFAKTAYKELVKYYKLSDVAPKELTMEESEGRPIVSDYRWYENKVVVYKDLFNKATKAQQLGYIAHELTHLKQTVNILRTEGLPVESYAFAIATSDFNAAMVRNPVAQKQYLAAKSQGKEKEFVAAIITSQAKKSYQELTTVFADVLEMPKHPLNSPEGQKALKDVEAQAKYNGAEMNAYNRCPMEKEARNVEDNLIKMYNEYYK